MFGSRRRRREAELAELDRWRTARRLLDDEVTNLGEQLAELHVDTLADDLGDEPLHHYRRALDHYDQAKHLLAASSTADDVLAVEEVVTAARWHAAAVLALRDGDPLPERREPCFFDPRHGPSTADVEWAPPSGAKRTIAVCAADARRLAGGEAPEVRLVRVGDRHVPWHQAGGIAAVIDEARHAAGERLGSLNRRHIGEAYARQGMSGANGAAGGFDGPAAP